MSIEDAISGALAAQLAPILAEIRRLASEVEAMRRALSKTGPETKGRHAAPVADMDQSAEASERSWIDGLEESADRSEPPAAPLPAAERKATP